MSKVTIKTPSKQHIIIILIAFICFIYSAYIALHYAKQIEVDFRQTQTALTAYWLIKNGFSLTYETPVLGPPWSIPFEFPIYQYIVALISKCFHTPLNATGRIISYIFLVLCLIPVRSFTKKLQLSDSVFYIFAALLFSSPVYLYWGRSFMIETASLFFALTGIKYFIDIINNQSSYKNILLFSVFMTLSLLQKATTGLPVILILGLIYIYLILKQENSLTKKLFNQTNLIIICAFLIPLIMTVFWTSYTDQIKLLNPVGRSLTSSVLKTWNFGTLKQRLSFNDLYIDLIYDRVFNKNLFGILGIVILIIPFLLNIPRKLKSIISILMAFAPFFIFTNLHIRHGYYQTANIIFFLYAVSVAIGQTSDSYQKNSISVLLTTLIVLSNYFNFKTTYFDFNFKITYFERIKEKLNAANSTEVAVAKIIKKYVPENKYFIAFGNGWSSTIAYLAERKSFTVPHFFEKYKEISEHPERFIPESNLGAIVILQSSCPPSVSDLNQ